jgi:hypothetical protein
VARSTVSEVITMPDCESVLKQIDKDTLGRPTCLNFGINSDDRRLTWPGFLFCSNCDDWEKEYLIQDCKERMNQNSARYRCTTDHTSWTQPTHRSRTILNFDTLDENDKDDEMPYMLQNNDGHSPDHESVALDEPETDDEEDPSPDEPRRHIPLEVTMDTPMGVHDDLDPPAPTNSSRRSSQSQPHQGFDANPPPHVHLRVLTPIHTQIPNSSSTFHTVTPALVRAMGRTTNASPSEVSVCTIYESSKL